MPKQPTHLPVDPSKKSQLENAVQELYSQGKGRNEIARALQVTTYRVDQAARALGLEFDTSRTEEAVKALKARAAYEREQLAGMWRDIAFTNLHEAVATADVPTAAYPYVKNAGVATEKDALLAKILTDSEHDVAQERAGEFLGSFMDSVKNAAAAFAAKQDTDHAEAPTPPQREDPP